MVTIQVSFLLRRLRTLLANDSRKRARYPQEACQGTRKGYPYSTTGGPAEPS